MPNPLDAVAAFFAIICFLLACFVGAVLVECRYYCSEQDRKFGMDAFCHCAKEVFLRPFYYFFGYQCEFCKKKYFSSKKAYSCCRNKPRKINFSPTSETGSYAGRKKCPNCSGGWVNGVKCEWCGGSGFLP